MPPSATDTGEPRSAAPSRGTADARLGVVLLVGGLIGLIAAVALLAEKIALLKNPDHIPSCDVSPVLSCGSVMTTPQAEVFGIPNPIIGIAGFAVVTAIGAALRAGGSFARWFWIALQAGMTLAVVFVHGLIVQSLYVIGALCPYCMVVWAVTIPTFWWVTVRNIGAIGAIGGGRRSVALLTEFRSAFVTGWFLVVVALIAVRFWDYWTTLV